jgi:phospholipase/carboxylesterase
MMGFSQGAALVYAYSLFYPEEMEKVVCMAGFLPENAEAQYPQNHLSGVNYFVAHGTEDDTVPIAKAHSTIKTLVHFGANVDYCEDKIGHKLSASCFSGLENFLAE